MMKNGGRSLRFGIRKLFCFGHRQCLNQATQKTHKNLQNDLWYAGHGERYGGGQQAERMSRLRYAASDQNPV